MSTFVDIVNSIIDFRQELDDFRSSGIYKFFTQWFAEFIKWSMVGWFKFKLQSLTFAWDVASEILNSLNLSEHIYMAFSALDSNVVSIISFFRIPEAIHIILSAYTTRLVMTFIGI
ncbi:MAG: DUF2523 family protein [Methylococcaceae bacterium]